jgi:transcriptional regulator with XRE-family HTH domain
MHASREELGRRLLEARLKRRKTLVRTAMDVGVSPTHLSEWEKGHHYPRLDSLAALAQYYRVSVDWLIGQEVLGPCPTCARVREALEAP